MDVDRSTSSVNVVGPRGAVAKASAMLQYTIGENKRESSHKMMWMLCLHMTTCNGWIFVAVGCVLRAILTSILGQRC